MEKLRKEIEIIDLIVLLCLPVASLGLNLSSLIIQWNAFSISCFILSIFVYYMNHQAVLLTHEKKYARSSRMKKYFIWVSLNWRYYNYLKLRNIRVVNGVNFMFLCCLCVLSLYTVENTYDRSTVDGESARWLMMGTSIIVLALIIGRFFIYAIYVINTLIMVLCCVPCIFLFNLGRSNCTKLTLNLGDLNKPNPQPP